MLMPEVMIVLGVIALLAASYGYYCLRTGVPTFPSMPVARDKIIGLLRADAARAGGRKPYVIYDLGSGSGQLSWHIARAMPEAQVVGIEISFIPWLRSVLRQKLTGRKNLRYLRVSFWEHSIAGADAVTTYLMEAIMPRISAKLHAELRPGALVISNKFALPGWQPVQTLPLQSAFSKQLLVYRHQAAAVPAMADEPPEASAITAPRPHAA